VEENMQVQVSNREAFLELQSKLVDTSRLLSQVMSKLQFMERERRRSDLTLKELGEISPETKTYKAIGKMFLSSSSNSLQIELKTFIQKTEHEMQNLLNQQKYLENSLKECEKGIQELIVKE